MTIALVVDDSAVDRKLAGRLLEKSGQYTVDYAVSGADALARLEQSPPDVVVTDLQMPELTGLDLVEAVRATHPLIPVVLMTAHGSEEIAVEALQRGAAGYVPKSRMAADLVDTVDNVVSTARAGRRHERLASCLSQTQWSYVLDNDSALIPPLVDLLQQNIAQMGMLDETGRIRVGIAAEEALRNALYHGNLELSSEDRHLAEERRFVEPYCDRRLLFEARLSREEVCLTVRDQGPGFDRASVPDPTDPANLEKESGRGLLLMRAFMDEVEYNASGNQVTLIKRRDSNGAG